MSDHELSVTRHIDAPVDIVWCAWVEHIAEWFCPRPWTAEFTEQDLRTGGRMAVTMRGPAGEEHRWQGVYLEVTPQRRIVSTDAVNGDWEPQTPFLVRIDSFEPVDGGTRYTAIARHWSAEVMADHEARGFDAGWGAAADQLAEIAGRLAAAEHAP